MSSIPPYEGPSEVDPPTDMESVPRYATPPEVDPLRTELETFLRNDETRLGDVYRGLQSGLDADAIASEEPT